MFGLFIRKKRPVLESPITPVYYPYWWRDTDEHKERLQQMEDITLAHEIKRKARDFAYSAAQRPKIIRDKFGMGIVLSPTYSYTIHHEETAKYKDRSVVYNMFKEEATKVYNELEQLFPY